jgi:1-deoxy-D-xylulose-5-phosphate reductoisomerase
MREEQKIISVLGSTGSVGEQALDVALKRGLRVACVSANKNVKRGEEQVRQLGIKAAAMADEDSARLLKITLADTDVKIYSGDSGICEMIADTECHTVVNSIIGEAGLLPTLAVIDSGRRLALANKESLVVAGEIVMARARERGVEILPVDSEHSAIFQCLKSGKHKEIKKILLTASGGPFFGYTAEQLKGIGVSDALAHPTWKMGAKITIDSATLMNKGFEVIEAAHLFDVPARSIQVVVHRESIIHSMVEYIDNSIIAQMSVPDMRHCIQHALTYPHREQGVIKPLSLTDVGRLTFAAPDEDTFVLLRLARECMQKGGAMPAVLNAANEIAVAAFLKEQIGFLDIFDLVEGAVMSLQTGADAHTLDEILGYDRLAREAVRSSLKKMGR